MALVQSWATISGGTATPTSSFDALPKTGSVVLVCYSSWNGASPPATPTVQDNQGGTTSDYTLIASQVTPGASDNYRHAVFYRENISAPSGTFTVQVNQGGTYACSIFIAEVNETPTSSPIEQTASTTGTSNNPSLALAGATTAAKALVVGCISHNSGTPSLTNDATNLPILVREYEDNGSTEAQNLSLRRAASTGSYTASWAIGASVPWSAIAFAIKQTGTARSSLVGMAAPVFTATASTNLTPALPVGWLPDDIGILVGWEAGTVAGTQPTGWTNIAALTGNVSTAQRVEVYWRRMQAGDGNPTYTLGTTAIAKGARIYMIGGCPTTGDPWDTGTGAPTRSPNTTADTTHEFTNITTTAANEVVLALGFHDDDITSVTTISGWRKPEMYANLLANQAGCNLCSTTLGNDLGHYIQVRDMDAAGSVGSATVTVTATTAVSTGVLIAFQVASSGTTLTFNGGGTLDTAGALVKQIQDRRAGTFATAGTLARATSKSFAGTLASAGTLAKQLQDARSGTLGTAGALTVSRVKLAALAGTLGAAGALVKQINKPLAGTLGSAGAYSRIVSRVRSYAGTLGMAGAVAKATSKSFAGTLGTSGAPALLKSKLVSIGGTLATAGALRRQTNKPLAGTLATAGSLVRRIGKVLGGTLGTSGTGGYVPSGGLSLPFRDDFTLSIDAEWDQTDSQTVISVADERAAFAYTSGADGWNDPALAVGAWSRSDIGAFTALVRLSNQADADKGFRVGLSPSGADSGAANANYLEYHYPDLWTRFLSPVNTRRQRSTDHLYTVVPRPGGGFFSLVSAVAPNSEWGEFPAATIVDVTDSESDGSLYAHLAARRSHAEVDYAKVLATSELPTALTSRFGPALYADTFNRGSLGTTSEFGSRTYVTSGTVGISGNQLSIANGGYLVFDAGARGRIIELTVTCASGNFAMYFRNNGTTVNAGPAGTGYSFFMDTGASGIWDEANGGAVYQTGATLFSNGTHVLRLHDFGDTCRIFYDGADIGGAIATGLYGGQYGVGLFNYSGATLTVNDWAVWPDTVTLDNDFGPPDDPPTGQGTALFSDAFTLTNGTNLSGQNGWSSSGSGTWQANSNKAGMTAAATTGILYHSTGAAGADHEISADITLPSSTATYPTDWFPGVVVRYTDANNFVYARYLYQNNSPEIEVQEWVAGSGSLIGYVNLGAGALGNSSTHTLRLAVRGSEVAAYHDGELMVQCTTSVLTGGNAGIGVRDNLPHGTPAWDNVAIKATGNISLLLNFAGTLSSSGTLLKQTTRALAGTFATAGALSKQGVKSYTGTLATAGALAKTLQDRRGGTLATSGALSKATAKLLAGAFATAGSLGKALARRLTGTLGMAGGLGTSVTHGGATYPVGVAGTLGLAGTFARTLSRVRSYAGTLGTSGTVARLLNRALSGVLSTLGTLTKQDNRRPGGTMGLSGGLAVTRQKTLATGGTLGTSGALVSTSIRGVTRGGTLGLGGTTTTVRILLPVPDAPPFVVVGEPDVPQFTSPAEAVMPEAALLAFAPPPELVALGESGPAAGTGVAKELPPEFELRP